MPLPSRTRLPILTNLDLPDVSAEEREIGENLELFMDAKRSWKPSDWYGDLSNPMRDGRPKVVQHDQAFISVADIRRGYEDPNHHFGPIGWNSATGTLVYPDEVKEAMRLGYVCPQCSNKQEVIGSSECRIKGKDRGCGYVRAGSTGW